MVLETDVEIFDLVRVTIITRELQALEQRAYVLIVATHAGPAPPQPPHHMHYLPRCRFGGCIQSPHFA